MKTKSLILLSLFSFVSFKLFAASELGLCGQKKGQTAISLTRTACFGNCPAYTVLIYADGRTEYTGKAFVKVKGTKKYESPKSKVAELIGDVQKSDFFRLKDTYAASIVDIPTYTLCFADGQQEKKIVDHHGKDVGMPESVTNLENKIDEVANTGELIGPK
jgi:hypothetical protein